MTSYCSTSDLQSRLTLAGFDWAINLDGGDTVTSGEITRYVTPAIERADGEIDSKICLRYSLTAARGNAFLKYLAVDLATVFACTNGGRAATEQFLNDAKRARETLDAIQAGQLNVPGLNESQVVPYYAQPYDVQPITVVDMSCTRDY